MNKPPPQLVKGAALAVVVVAAIAMACGGAGQTVPQAQLAAIHAGCKVALDIERDAGDKDAEADTAKGCLSAERTWEHVK